MSYLESPLTIAAIVAIIIVIIVLIVYLIRKYNSPPAFKGTVLGHVREIDAFDIANALTDLSAGDVNSIVIVNKEEYVNKKGQMATACHISSGLLNGIKPEDAFNQILKKNEQNPATKHDLGGLIMANLEDNAINLYITSVNNVNEKPTVYKKSYFQTNLDHIAAVINNFYRQFQEQMPDAMVILINPKPQRKPNNNNGTTVISDAGSTDINNILPDTTLEDPNEDFGMYEGALASWLKTHPSGSSVDRYTKKATPTVHNINSVNNAVPAELTGTSIPVDLTNRFQSPQQYATEAPEELQSYYF